MSSATTVDSSASNYLPLTQKFNEAFPTPILLVGEEGELETKVLVPICKEFLLQNDIKKEVFEFEVSVMRNAKTYTWSGNAKKIADKTFVITLNLPALYVKYKACASENRLVLTDLDGKITVHSLSHE